MPASTDPNNPNSNTPQPNSASADPLQNKPADPSANPAPSSADIQAQIKAALDEQAARFTKEFKAATGFEDIKVFNENRLKEQGKLQELADARGKESDSWKSKFEQSQIRTALLTASAAAVDPSVISDLLSGRAVCDADGNVTIAGQPVEQAVKSLLDEKPFLAKPQGGTGSGSPQQADPSKKQLSRDAFEKLDPVERQKFLKDGGKVV